VAYSWLVTLFVIAAVLTVLVIIYEWMKKKGHERYHQWGKARILKLLLVALGLATITVVSVYFYSDDFQLVVRPPGLFVGILVSWIVCTIVFLLGHLIIPDFRRDLYGF